MLHTAAITIALHPTKFGARTRQRAAATLVSDYREEYVAFTDIDLGGYLGPLSRVAKEWHASWTTSTYAAWRLLLAS